MPAPWRSRLARWVSWIVAVPVAAAVVLFVVSNREVVQISLYPLPPFLGPVPLYWVGLGGVFAGFLYGGLVAWLSGRRWRRRARDEARARLRAAAENAALRSRLATAERDAETASGESVAPPNTLPAL